MGRDKLTSPHTGAVFLHESLQDKFRFFIACRLPSHMNPRFAVLLGKLGSPLRPTGKLAGTSTATRLPRSRADCGGWGTLSWSTSLRRSSANWEICFWARNKRRISRHSRANIPAPPRRRPKKVQLPLMQRLRH